LPHNGLPDDLEDCRVQLRVGSRSFHTAAFLFPREFREPASALYAFCRAADDAVDESNNAKAALQAMRERLDAVYQGQPGNSPADRALAQVVESHGLQKELLEALFEGFEWDVEGRLYPNLRSVKDYAARVAGSVGAMMAVLMGIRDNDRLARASDLGVAMQLTNIARDVGEDARLGRCYLPQDWLAEAGIDREAFLANPRFSTALGGVTRRLLAEADRLYQRADSGIARLPLRCRPAIYAARLLYAEIGNEVARHGYDSVSRRAVTTGWRKASLLARSLPLLPVMSCRLLSEPVLPETEFLVAAGMDPQADGRRPGMLARAEQKCVWVLDLFEDLDRRERRQPRRLPIADEPAV
jgi:phytoene synthase